MSSASEGPTNARAVPRRACRLTGQVEGEIVGDSAYRVEVRQVDDGHVYSMVGAGPGRGPNVV